MTTRNLPTLVADLLKILHPAALAPTRLAAVPITLQLPHPVTTREPLLQALQVGAWLFKKTLERDLRPPMDYPLLTFPFRQISTLEIPAT
jgi:hypothetical protein